MTPRAGFYGWVKIFLHTGSSTRQTGRFGSCAEKDVSVREERAAVGGKIGGEGLPEPTLLAAELYSPGLQKSSFLKEASFKAGRFVVRLLNQFMRKIRARH